jgi:hypothetical protein
VGPRGGLDAFEKKLLLLLLVVVVTPLGREDAVPSLGKEAIFKSVYNYFQNINNKTCFLKKRGQQKLV